MQRDLQRLTDEQLVKLACDDAEAIGVLYDRYVDVVLAFLHRRCGNAEVAADATAETFAAAFLSAGRYRPSRGSVRGWLFTIAKNKLYDAQRGEHAERRARERLGIIEPISFGDDLAAIDSRIDAGRAALKPALEEIDRLPPGERAAVLAIVIDGAPAREAAEQLSISQPTLRQRLHRGLGKLSTRSGRYES